MSLFLSVIATATPVVHAVATATPAVVAQATPVAVAHVNSISDTINALASKVSQTDLLLAAGFIATGVQYLINKFANLRKFTNQLLGVALPFLVVTPTLIDGFKLQYGAAVYVIAQVIYYAVEKIKATQASAPVVEVPVTQL